MFEKVQETRPEIDGVDETLAAARVLLLEVAHAERGSARTHGLRRGWAVTGALLGTAAAVTVGVLVVGAMTTELQPTVEAVPTRQPEHPITKSPAPAPAEATAQEVLQGAATAAAMFQPPILAQGQYLRRSWVHESLSLYDPSTGGWSHPGYGVSRSSATSAWVFRSSGSDYSPADLNAVWYREWAPVELAGIFGDVGEAQRQLEVVRQTEDLSGHPLVAGGPPLLPEGGPENVPWFFENMPKEPSAMIEWIDSRLGGEDYAGWSEGKIGWMLIGLLSYNVGDPAMRSAMYQALGLLPGSTVGPETNGERTVTFDSQLAAPGTDETSTHRYTLTIDMVTGLVMATSATSDAGEGVIPGDVADSRTTYVMSVVDGLP